MPSPSDASEVHDDSGTLRERPQTALSDQGARIVRIVLCAFDTADTAF